MKTVFFTQERGVTSTWNHDTLSLQYKLDNEFELVFVVAYQNILKLTYIDKFLNEMQLRFRDKYKQAIQGKVFNLDFSGFKQDFDSLLRECEDEARLAAQMASRPRKYHESEKSSKTMASIMESKKGFLTNLVGGGTTESLKPGAQPSSKANKKQIKEEEDDEEDSLANSNGNLNNAAALSASDDNEDVNDVEKKMSELMAAKKIGGRPKKFEKPKR
jgi:hypothetical protein